MDDWKQKVIFLPPPTFHFVALAFSFCLRQRGVCGGVGLGWGGGDDTHCTSAPPAALTFLPVCVRNIHQIRERTRFPPRTAHLFPPQCIESKCFSLWVLCGHMSVSSSHRLRLCSLLQEMLGLVSVESNQDRGFKECRENKQVCRCWALPRQARDK